MRSPQTQLDTHTLREAEITNPRLRRCFLYPTIISQPLMHNGSLSVCAHNRRNSHKQRNSIYNIV